MVDLVVAGGTVVDGTGSPGFTADVGVRDGRIVAVGRVDRAGARVIEADGALVTPGFVDLHTHYDGQATWDGELAPSALHGVTTAVMGSCGVGFAPVHAADRQRLIELMEGVEDIPGTALHEGLRWRWETFGEYLDALDALPHTVDLGCHVPHDALRVYVMRDRALAGAPATEADVAAMRDVLRRALLDGALGFSTGRSDNHRSAKGEATPAAEAGQRELEGLASAFVGLDHGVLQAVSDFDLEAGPHRFTPEFDLLEAFARASGGRPFSLSLMQRDGAPGQYKRILERVEAANAAGLRMRIQVAPRGIGVLLGLQATFHPFMGFPSYKAVAGLPLAERVARLRDPATKARLLAERSEPVAGDGSPLPPLADQLLAAIALVALRTFRLTDPVDYEPRIEASLGFEAHRRGVSVLEALYDALLEDEGRALLYFPLYNYTSGDLSAVREMLVHPDALPGLSDGGAHVGTICDASFPTTLLSWWGRDRPTGRLPLERLVEFQTRRTAGHLGLRDRGTIEVGKRADLNVIDLPRLRNRLPHVVADLPAGGRRIVQEADGYLATLVAGQVVVEQGRFTGARPGRVVRGGRRA